MLIHKNIRYLRNTALLLFIVPLIGLVGSLLVHNYLVSYKYYHDFIVPFKTVEPGSTFELLCSKEDLFCSNFKKMTKLDQCNKYLIIGNKFSKDGLIKLSNDDVKQLDNQEKYMNKYTISDQLNENCILNSKNYYLYKIFPSYFEYLANSNFTLGTSKSVNPLIYGETSISNIVKRHPIKFVFKPLMFLSVFLMVIYWSFYNNVLNRIFQIKRTNIFLIFGVLSAIFLFLHVYFLGQKYEAEVFNKIRRSYIVFFILFEILAQAYLLKIIWKKRNDLKNYFDQRILISKFSFVIFVAVSSFIILTILIFKNLSAKIDYILEWNYFLILLIYYLLSFLIWKKSSFRNPSSA